MKLETIAASETVGDFIARYLAEIGVTTVFGVISIHNMPILDAIARQERIRFVPARGEAGAMNMADAFARVSGELGVCMTSTVRMPPTWENGASSRLDGGDGPTPAPLRRRDGGRLPVTGDHQ